MLINCMQQYQSPNKDDSFVFQGNLNNFKGNFSVQRLKDLFERETHFEVLKIECQLKTEVEDDIDDDEQLVVDDTYLNYRVNEYLRNLINANTLKFKNMEPQEEEELIEMDQGKHHKKTSDQVSEFLKQLFEVYFQKRTKIDKIKSPMDMRDNIKRVTVTFKAKRDGVKLLRQESQDRRFKCDGSEPIYIKKETVNEVDEYLQKDYELKNGKLCINLLNFQLGQLMEVNEDDNLEFRYYFDSIRFKGSMKVDQKLYLYDYDYRSRNNFKQLEIFIMIEDSQILRIEFQIDQVQFAYSIEEGDKTLLYLKFLSPPAFSVAEIKENRFEIPQNKDDWRRVHNFILDSLQNEGKIDLLERIHLINNTTMKLIAKSDNQSKEYMKSLLQRLNELKVLDQSKDIDDDNKEYLGQVMKFSKLQSCNLPFAVKYDLLVLLSKNYMNLDFQDSQFENVVKYLVKVYRSTKPDDLKRIEYVMEVSLREFQNLAKNLNSDYRYRKILLRNISQFEREFQKNQEDLIPKDYEDEESKLAYIRSLSLTPSGILFSSKEPEMTNRVLRLYKEKQDSFIRLHFQDESLQMLKNHQYICEVFFKSMIIKGIEIFDRNYRILTWSSSQLRGSSCWFFDTTSANLQRQQIINRLGTFRGIKPVAKYAARLGQQFSTSMKFTLPNDVKITFENDETEDLKHKKYTDGIGMISDDLLDDIRKKINTQVCAIQIRFGGAKGVLLLNTKLPPKTIVLRKSMVKFNPPNGKYESDIQVLDYNKFRGGYMNRQIIMLLLTLKIQDEVFMQIQREYLHQLDHISMIDASIYKYFNIDYTGETLGIPSAITIVQDLINAQIDPEKNQFIQGILKRLRQRGYHILKTKANLLVEKAARLIGVVDDYDVLEENEIYASFSTDGKSITNITGAGPNQFVVVTRNPCLHPGDVRKLQAVSDQQVIQRKGFNYFEKYANCIFFPKKGPKAITAQIAGGDLDGDLYFIAWDERLIFEKNVDPFVYDEESVVNTKKAFRDKPNVEIQDYSEEEMIDFMLEYLTSDVLGKIDNSHLALAEKSEKMAMDDKCIQLAGLHSKAVDYVKTGEAIKVPSKLLAKEWPDYMEKPNKIQEFQAKSALGLMYREVKELIEKKRKDWEVGIFDGFGLKEVGLPPLHPHIIYGFQDLLQQLKEGDIMQVNKQNYQPKDSDGFIDAVIPQMNVKIINSFIEKNYKPHLEIVAEAIQHAFSGIRGIIGLFNLNDEYELYSGNISSFLRGDGIHQKQKLNVENVQKQLILRLSLLNAELNHLVLEGLAKLHPQSLQRVSLMHLIMNYSLDQFVFVETPLTQFLQLLFKQMWKILKPKLHGFNHWYRGFTTFFFHEQVIKVMNFERESEEQVRRNPNEQMKQEVMEQQQYDDEI